MHSVRIIEIPPCKMVSSGTGFFGEESFTKFNDWISALKPGIYPKDFVYNNGEGFCWLYLYEDGLTVPEDFEIVDFEGGLYAVATDIDGRTDIAKMNAEVDAFLKVNGLIEDESRYKLGNITTSPKAQAILGYCQMDYYTPVKAAPSA